MSNIQLGCHLISEMPIHVAQSDQLAETRLSYQFLFLVKSKALLIIAVGRLSVSGSPKHRTYGVPFLALRCFGTRRTNHSPWLRSMMATPLGNNNRQIPILSSSSYSIMVHGLRTRNAVFSSNAD